MLGVNNIMRGTASISSDEGDCIEELDEVIEEATDKTARRMLDTIQKEYSVVPAQGELVRVVERGEDKAEVRIYWVPLRDSAIKLFGGPMDGAFIKDRDSRLKELKTLLYSSHKDGDDRPVMKSRYKFEGVSVNKETSRLHYAFVFQGYEDV